MKSKLISSIILATVLTLSLPVVTGCNNLKPVPVAEGHDAVVVNAERIQISSLAIYEQTTKWEYAHRAALPSGVSRAVDKFRAEFPSAWKQSREALALYKRGTGPDATAMDKVTTALSIAQSSLLSLMVTGSDADILQARNAMTSLLQSVNTLLKPKIQ